jgi:integrase
MAKLTVKEVAALQKRDKPYKVAADKGLLLRVSASGVKTWIVQYVIDGKQRDYPLARPWGKDTDGGHLSLADARAEAERIRALARDGIDYQVQREQQAKAEAETLALETATNATVNDLFDAWIKTTTRTDGGVELRRAFDKDVLPIIGTTRLKNLVEGDIVSLLEKIVKRGSDRQAVLTLGNLKQMFRWAGGRRPWKLLLDNPAANLKAETLTSKGYDGAGRDRHLSADEILELSQKLPAAGLSKRIEYLVWIILSCATRIGETVMARWENVDLETGVWRIPPPDTKNKIEHTVFLSPFAIECFQQLHDLPGKSEWCFPNAVGTGHTDSKNATKMIRDRQMSAMNRKPMKNRSTKADALILAGGDWVPHDLRRTGATMMQSLGVTPDLIEKVLNHVEQNKLKKIYHQYDYAREKREAWRLLGNRLALILNPAENVITLARRA